MPITTLNTRRKKILQGIVELYDETAQPVSSQAVTRRLRSKFSSATVRNIMAELEQLGLLWQPYTSAGRIPTDKGYRYYIDALIEVEQLTLLEQELIEKRYPKQSEVFDELLGEILDILSNFSGYTALAFSSGLRRILLKKLEFVSLQSTKLLLVLVSQAGLVRTALVQLPYAIEQSELFRITRFLNEEFSGLNLDQIKDRLSQRLFSINDAFFYLIKKAQQILDLAFSSFDKDRLYLEGTSYILEQPEFQDARKLQPVLRVFEKRQPLLEIMREDLDSEGVKVHIGKENTCRDIQECSLVVSNFKIKNRSLGSLGVIGPRRMPYPKVISTVNFMTQTINKKLANFTF